jgi:uncharacterized protein YdaU (DUF1376 family)
MTTIRKIAEHNNAPVDTEQVLKDMLEQVTNEVKDGLDDKSVEVAIALDVKMNERVDAVFQKHWNEKLRNWVEKRIQEEVAELGLKLGKSIGELMSDRGRL